MSDAELTCSRCGQASVELDESIYASCRDQQAEATIPPTPNLYADATILPGQTNGGAFAAEQIGDYDLIEEIARGGMGVVLQSQPPQAIDRH